VGDGYGDELLGLLVQGARREHLPAELVKRVVDAGSQLLAPMRDLSIGRGIDRLRHRVPPLADRSLGSLLESTRPTREYPEGSPRLMTEDCFKRMVTSIRSKLHSVVVGAVGGPRVARHSDLHAEPASRGEAADDRGEDRLLDECERSSVGRCSR